MAKKSTKAERRLEFAIEEIVLSFIGALVISFGIVVLNITQGSFWANFVLAIFVIWLGLLLFMVPIIRKIEQLM